MWLLLLVGAGGLLATAWPRGCLWCPGLEPLGGWALELAAEKQLGEARRGAGQSRHPGTSWGKAVGLCAPGPQFTFSRQSWDSAEVGRCRASVSPGACESGWCPDPLPASLSPPFSTPPLSKAACAVGPPFGPRGVLRLGPCS